LTYRYTNEEAGKMLRRYWTTACPHCPLKSQCTTGSERRITRWEHEHVLEVVQQRLDKNPQAMRLRRETAEHPFATRPLGLESILVPRRFHTAKTRSRLRGLSTIYVQQLCDLDS
jgi:hypothetical protein